MNHTDLCKLTAEKFVQTIALYEVKGHWENTDVITWNSSGTSTVFEIKMSRSDFLADRKKKCRKEGETPCGDFFAYVCFGDFIKKEEVPENWGLFYYKNGKFRCIKQIPKNYHFMKKDQEGVYRKDWNAECQFLINYILCSKFYGRNNIVYNRRYLNEGYGSAFRITEKEEKIC